MSKYKRKTPCHEHRVSMLRAVECHCYGCGEWLIENGKAVRP
jgi:hypothetical protein